MDLVQTSCKQKKMRHMHVLFCFIDLAQDPLWHTLTQHLPMFFNVFQFQLSITRIPWFPTKKQFNRSGHQEGNKNNPRGGCYDRGNLCLRIPWIPWAQYRRVVLESGTLQHINMELLKQKMNRLIVLPKIYSNSKKKCLQKQLTSTSLCLTTLHPVLKQQWRFERLRRYQGGSRPAKIFTM